MFKLNDGEKGGERGREDGERTVDGYGEANKIDRTVVLYCIVIVEIGKCFR